LDIDCEEESILSKVLFSTWQGEFIDNRGKPKEEWEESAFKVPDSYEGDKNSKIFIGWNGLAIFDESVDVIKAATMYAAQYQEYSEACGRCAPGRWGGRILYDLFDKIARGEGSKADVDHLKEISKTMQLTSKCEIGRTVPTPLLHVLEYFEDEIDDLIKNQKKSKDYDNEDINYIAKVTAPCIDACPDHVDIPAYIEGVRDLQFIDSLKATKQTMPLAHTCGRVCPHPCEDACRRDNLDEAISIMELKRIGADYESDHALNFNYPKEPKPLNGKKVLIVGAGPAGLTAAYYLALEGVASDVYDYLPVPGGEVSVGVPEYRMPYHRYQKDIEAVEALDGVTFHLNTKVTADMLRKFEKEYDAILLASGTRISKKVRAKNENPDHEGYWPAISFLDQINLNVKWNLADPVDLSGKTIVCVGGGFTSMDVVRCSIRAGAKKVIMIYRRDEKTIIRNTSYEEYHEAVEEGVEFIFHSAIEEIVDKDGKIEKLKMNKFELVPDPDGGRAQLVKIEGADYELECDYLIPAVSQDADLDYIPEEWELELTSWNTLKTDGKTYVTSKKGIFAAGDCEYGPMTIVNAVGQAKRAASVMSRFVHDGKLTLLDEEIMEDHLNRLKVYNKNEKVTGWVAGLPREVSEKLDVDVRKHSQDEVNFGFTQEQAVNEATRCMRCYYIAMVAV
jgi:formate dehydrogenase beta subunit